MDREHNARHGHKKIMQIDEGMTTVNTGVKQRRLKAASSSFLRATAGTAIARLSHRNSVWLSVCPSVTRVDQAKTVQARIIKSSPSAAPKTLVSGSVTLFQKIPLGSPQSRALNERG